MGIDRRQFLKASMVATGSLIVGSALLHACYRVSFPRSGVPVRVVVLISFSGPMSIFSPPIEMAAKLAHAEINAGGGILGRPVELVLADDGTDPVKGRETIAQLVGAGKVDMVIGMHSSATRKAVIPVIDAVSIPYWYTALWEAHECHPHLTYLGEVPSQQLAPMIPFLMQQYGKGDWYLVGNDYIWGQRSVEQARAFITAAGGTVVGSDMVPLGTTDYSPVVERIAQKNPGLVYAPVAGADAVVFNRQMYEFGLRKDVVTLGGALEEMTVAGIGAQAAAGLWSSLAYFHSLDTPNNRQFISRYTKQYGVNAPAQTTFSEGVYTALHLFAKAADKAGSLGPVALSEAAVTLEIEAPRGLITVNPRTHYATHHIYAAQVGADGSLKVQHDFGAVAAREKC